MSEKFPGKFPEMSLTFPGSFLDFSQKCSTAVLHMSVDFLNNYKTFLVVSGQFKELSRTLLNKLRNLAGRYQENLGEPIRICSGNITLKIK